MLQREKNLDIITGAYVDSLLENSAAGAAGIRKGDVIVEVNGVEIESSPALQEVIARHRPGDKLTVTVNRNGKEKQFQVVLNNRRGNTEIVEKEHKEVANILGATFESIDEQTARRLDIEGGVKITELYAGKLLQQTNIREGFIIIKVDGQNVRTVDELINILEKKQGGIMLEGVYEDLPGVYYYAFGLQ